MGCTHKDRLSHIFPPNTAPITPNLIFSYLYDEEDNIIIKTVPDSDTITYAYDARNIQTGMQNGVLRSEGSWLGYELDDYGRITKTGFLSNIANGTNPTIPSTDVIVENYYDGGGTISNAAPIYKGKLRESRVRQMDGFTIANPAQNGWIRKIYEYDAHGRIDSLFGSNHLYPSGFSECIAFDYDWADNLTEQRRFTQPDGGTTHEVHQRMTYDHEGRLLTEAISPNSTTQQETCRMNYSPKDELLTKFLGKTSSSYLQECNYFYNPQSWLERINNFVPYTSTIDTCMSMTGGGTTSTSIVVGSDLFSLQLHYDQASSPLNAPVQKNGNIAQVHWQVFGTTRQQYGFNYDYQDRLIQSTYGQTNPSNGLLDVNNYFDTEYSYDSRGNILTLKRNGLFYDEENDCHDFGPIDDLTYHYHPNSNRIQRIDDAVNCQDFLNLPSIINQTGIYAADIQVSANNTIQSNQNVTYQGGQCVELTAGFEFDPTHPTNGGGEFLGTIAPCPTPNPTPTGVGIASSGFNQTSTENYTYDAGGNLKYDPNKQFKYEYNWLNLPYRMVSTDGTKEIRIVYDANGTKLRKEVFENGVLKYKQDYNEGIEYRNDTIQAVYFEDGRIFNEGMLNQTSESWRYEYRLADHLDNTRITFSDKNGDGMISLNSTDENLNEILSEESTYPFGLSMNYNTLKGTSSPTKYTYNNKEFNADFGLNILDYWARYYDPAIGRWNAVDPLAEQYYPFSSYNYTLNNPIRFIDPDGRSVDDIIVNGVTYTPGATYDSNEDAFVAKTFDALNSLSNSSKTAAEQINTLVESDHDFTIVESSGETIFYASNSDAYREGPGSGGTIKWNPNSDTAQGVETTEGYQVNVKTNLIHEAGHAARAAQGKGSANFRVEEIATSHIENKVRGEIGAPLRPFYQAPIPENFNFLTGDLNDYQIPLINSQGKSIHYNSNDKKTNDGPRYEYKK